MWDFFETVRHRHSIRVFREDMPVDDAQLHAILETACAAPSAGDLQSYHISVVKDAGKLLLCHPCKFLVDLVNAESVECKELCLSPTLALERQPNLGCRGFNGTHPRASPHFVQSVRVTVGDFCQNRGAFYRFF